MNFRTKVELPAGILSVGYQHRLMSLGSCFSEHIGNRLSDAKFACDVNPFGILYNPFSIACALETLLDGRLYDETSPELFVSKDGWWHSFMHHSRFSASSRDECLRLINGRLSRAMEALPSLDFLLLTLGTSYVYCLKGEDGVAADPLEQVVANCHKLPESRFVRLRVSPDAIVRRLGAVIGRLLERRPTLQVLFTVSPIRHARDGFHANQLSKSALLLAVDELCATYPCCHYFPAYEIVLDELRDYRFYADDMLHPSPLAIDYVWECFTDACLTAEARSVMAECQEIRRALEHRPFHPEAPQYKNFLTQIVLRINRLTEKCPTLDFKKELELCHTRLNQ